MRKFLSNLLLASASLFLLMGAWLLFVAQRTISRAELTVLKNAGDLIKEISEIVNSPELKRILVNSDIAVSNTAEVSGSVNRVFGVFRTIGRVFGRKGKEKCKP